ncbi:hypothetical protein ACWD3I_25385 [Streptomyces sp. NPDC002817]|uniref:hypothetical protein n=1 Tax=Streptomyces sp. NPDC088357 TaxID=3154655 RepID=UPI0034405A99
MRISRLVPVIVGGALAASISTTPASANSGWWFSRSESASGYYNSSTNRVTACDIRTDGYKALVQITTLSESLLSRTADDLNNKKCTTKKPSYVREGSRYKIQVCIVKVGQRPKDCGSLHEFTA